ncbi:hypothetical protein HDU96_003067 [Phlyctochytrium bullatum]|nr:hypothetical protein HDU96_003067 [Phlyctochytrium bullatum]
MQPCARYFFKWVPTLIAYNGRLEIVRFFVERGTDIEGKDGCKRTPLLCAASGGNLDVAQYLVEMGAYVGARDWDGKTGSELALKYRYPAVAEYLEAQERRTYVVERKYFPDLSVQS